MFQDPRMMVRQDLSAGEWQLIIKDVRYSDAGQYECQINTSPVLSHTLKLAVVGKFFYKRDSLFYMFNLQTEVS